MFFIHRSLRTKEKAIHRQLYLAMLIQVVIRLILYTDQVITRGSSASSKAGNSTASGADNAGASNIVRGIDNTVSRNLQHYVFKALHITVSQSKFMVIEWMFAIFSESAFLTKERGLILLQLGKNNY